MWEKITCYNRCKRVFKLYSTLHKWMMSYNVLNKQEAQVSTQSSLFIIYVFISDTFHFGLKDKALGGYPEWQAA